MPISSGSITTNKQESTTRPRHENRTRLLSGKTKYNAQICRWRHFPLKLLVTIQLLCESILLRCTREYMQAKLEWWETRENHFLGVDQICHLQFPWLLKGQFVDYGWQVCFRIWGQSLTTTAPMLAAVIFSCRYLNLLWSECPCRGGICASTVILDHGSESQQGIWINASPVEQTGTGGCRSTSFLNAREMPAVSTTISSWCPPSLILSSKNFTFIRSSLLNVWSSGTWVSVFSKTGVQWWTKPEISFLPKSQIYWGVTPFRC